MLLLLKKKTYHQFVWITLLFGTGFSLYLFAMSYVSFSSRELTTIVKRLCLLLVFIPIFIDGLLRKYPYSLYWNRPHWNNTLSMPFIWSGPHRVKIPVFLIIAISINIITFIPFLFQKGLPYMQHILLFALLFSIVNGMLEECIWRGILLHYFSNQFGEKWAVILTSIGFGLQHYSLGFSWLICIAFILAGVFYGGIVVKSNSIIPAIIWHVALNILMVCSGLIL
ncbi:CPBP family intramembrane metalloprotease [Bacillus sp. DX1.1]|uniref:CPBP family intramembrane glutamic endopeptidase n=1 Tax=Bacillus sp. DX3.1 TaxID=3052091 RepID=UPI0025704D2F|nr:CPBP family intramembrane glutamic endopeptidase [Bacillus sp. DX3.1]MDM5156555.1 CPBP family intramembrane metalloprotease [Bacillus sp. DX1.1]WJE80818.1 CPBP family intramembrane metalloprotease [Bacillus sp. DX3.1]